MLLNVVLEYAMAKWKRKLTSHGFCLHPNNVHERHSNVRYVDDILLFAKSLEEGVHMVELLAEVFREFGLELTSKTKILSTEHVEDRTIDCTIDCGVIEIPAKCKKQKYLGRLFTRDISTP